MHTKGDELLNVIPNLSRGNLAMPPKGAPRLYPQYDGVRVEKNRSVLKSNGKLLPFLDSDDLWTLAKLKAQIDSESCDIVISLQAIECSADNDRDSVPLDETAYPSVPLLDRNGFVNSVPLIASARRRFRFSGTLRRCRDWFSRASLTENSVKTRSRIFGGVFTAIRRTHMENSVKPRQRRGAWLIERQQSLARLPEGQVNDAPVW